MGKHQADPHRILCLNKHNNKAAMELVSISAPNTTWPIAPFTRGNIVILN